MTRITYLIAFCLFTQLLSAESSSAEPKEKKLFIGVTFAPGVAFRTLRATAHTQIEDMVLASDNKFDKPMFGFNTGINIVYKFNKTIALEMGVSYTQMGYKDVVDSAYFLANPTPVPYYKIVAYNRYNYINIPLMAKFYAGKHKVKFIGGAGFVFDFLFGTIGTAQLIEPSGHVASHVSLNTFPAAKSYNFFSMSGTASAGIDYRINTLMGIRFEPYISHQFLSLYKEGTIKHYLWNAGVNVAYYFGVK